MSVARTLRPSRVLVLASTLVALLCTCAPARAWVERAVRSDSVTVDLERDGTAVVTHDLLLFVRGGPLPEISIEPVDADASALPDATVTLARSGKAAGLPQPLALSVEGTRLTLQVVGSKGLRGGTHLFHFSYRTNLAQAGKVRPGPAGTTLEWNGPSFTDGIDSAKVVFRVPRGAAAPRLRASSASGAVADIQDDRDGVFLSTYRRAGDKDEMEVVRPHTARGESVSWRILVDRSAVDLASAPPVQAAQVDIPAPALPDDAAAALPVVKRPRRLPMFVPVVAALAAFLLGLAVYWKSRWVRDACAPRRATPRPMLPLPAWLRAVLASAGLLAAVAVVIASAPPLAFAAALLVALAASTQLPPRAAAPLRGPGTWVELAPDVAYDAPPAPRSKGRLLDAGTLLGFTLFVSLLVGCVAGALFVMPHSAYHGLSLALGSVLLFPVFCTGRAAELPPDPATAPAELLEALSARLAQEGRLEARPVGRVPQGASTHDELRLVLRPAQPVPGFVAIEVGMDFHSGALGVWALPFVLVRVVEGSPAFDAMPRGLLWTRGRVADERVAVLRPRLPTLRVLGALVDQVVRYLSISRDAGAASKRRGASGSVQSGGGAASTTKPGKVPSPAHAT